MAPTRRSRAAAAAAAAKAAAVEEEEDLEMEHEEEAEEAEEEEEEQQEEQQDDDQDDQGEELAKLKFNQPLTWRAGKPIPTGELHRRLDALHKELEDLDQDTTDKASVAKIAKDLVSHNLLAHKDKGVKAFVACCLVDVMRICAPNAPFTPAQLKDVFTLIINHILPALQDPSNTYNTQHKYVLASLAEVESIVLLNDIDNNEGLLLQLFSSFFDAVSGPKSASGERISKEVEVQMSEVLYTVIHESTSLPGKVVDVIMAQFLRAAAPRGSKDRADVEEGQSTLLLKSEPEAYLMAKLICNRAADKMARFVAQYFGDVIMDVTTLGGRHHGKGGNDSDDESHANGPTESDLKELRKAHQLIRELWRACPAILPNVIAQVDAELEADNVHLRQLATETLGDMISGIGAAGPPPPPKFDPAAYPPPSLTEVPDVDATTNVLTRPYSPQPFSKIHPVVYQNFVGRRHDKSTAIRVAWTTAVGYILSTSAGGSGLKSDETEVLVEGLRERLNDAEERVRLAGVRAIDCFSFREVIMKLAPHGHVNNPKSVLSALADRIRDRKHQVRVEAMVLLGKLWAASTGELVSNPEKVSALAGIPSRIYGTVYANDPELNLLRDRVRFEYLVPLTFPHQPKKPSKATNGNSQSQPQNAAASIDADDIRGHRILLMAASLEGNAKIAFLSVENRQTQFVKVMDVFLESCELNNGGVASGDEGKKAAARLAQHIDYISKFFPDQLKLKQDLNKFAKVNDRRSYQLIKFIIDHESDFKTMHRAMRELLKRFQGPNLSVMDSLLPLVYMCGYIFYNKSHLSTFLEYSRTNKDGLAAISHDILNEISQKIPTLFKTHIGSLCKDLQQTAPTASQPNEPIVVETLKACASFAIKYAKDLPNDKRFIQTLMAYAMYGVPPTKAAKYAVNVLLARKDKESLLFATDLLRKVMADFKFGSPHFLNKLAAVCQLELLAPKVTEDFEEDILQTTHGLLREARTEASTDEKTPDPEWIPDDKLDEEGQAKCLALRILVNRVLAISDREEAKTRGEVVVKLLRTLVTKEGEISKGKETPVYHRKRLRLLAAQLILKLCTHVDDLLSPQDFNRLAEVAQDAQPKVRHGFIEKLQKYLALGKLRPRFYTIIFLTAYEPDEEFKHNVETWIRSRARNFQETNSPVMETTLCRLISLLAHHPDFEPTAEGLISHAVYFIFYASNVATESNLGLLQKYAERTKQTQDALSPKKSESIYMLCDLALAVLRRWQQKRGWALEAYSQKVGLPLGLFAGLRSHDEAQKIASKQYIPEGVEDKVDEMIRAIDRKKKRKFDDSAEPQDAKKKSKAAAAKGSSQPKDSSKSKTPRSSRKPRLKSASARPKKVQASSPTPVPDHERRRSGRAVRAANSTYMERDSDEDDQEMLDGVAEWDYGGDSEDESVDEEVDSDAGEKRPTRRGTAAKRASSAASSALSLPEPMDEDPQTEEEAKDDSDLSEPPADDDGAAADADSEEDEEDRSSRANRQNGKKPPPVASSAKTPTRPSRAAATAASTKKTTATKPTTTRLATRTKPAGRTTRRGKEAHDVDDDDD